MKPCFPQLLVGRSTIKAAGTKDNRGSALLDGRRDSYNLMCHVPYWLFWSMTEAVKINHKRPRQKEGGSFTGHRLQLVSTGCRMLASCLYRGYCRATVWPTHYSSLESARHRQDAVVRSLVQKTGGTRSCTRLHFGIKPRETRLVCTRLSFGIKPRENSSQATIAVSVQMIVRARDAAEAYLAFSLLHYHRSRRRRSTT